MIDKVFEAALREEYNRLPQDIQAQFCGFWHFAASLIFGVFSNTYDDYAFEWKLRQVDKYAAAILAHNPDFAEDEEIVETYFSDFDFEA